MDDPGVSAIENRIQWADVIVVILLEFRVQHTIDRWEDSYVFLQDDVEEVHVIYIPLSLFVMNKMIERVKL